MEATTIGILNVIGLLGISWWYWKVDTSSIKIFYWPALLFKVTCGILLGILYTYYYSANDTFYFFDAAVNLGSKAHVSFSEYIVALVEPDPRYFAGEARSLFFVKILSIIALLTYGNYWIASIYFSLLTFYAAWYLTKQVVKEIPSARLSAVIAFLFFPSAVFWSSGIIKESLAMAALFLLSAVVIKIWFKQRVSVFVLLLSAIAVWLVWNLKYYYIGLFLPIVCAALAVKWISSVFKIKTLLVELLVFLFILFIGLSSASLIHPNFNLSVIADVLVTNNEAFMVVSSSEDVIHYNNLRPSLISLLANAPWALFSGLYRPFIWECSSVIQSVAATENLVLFFFTFVGLAYWHNIRQSPFRILVVAVLVYSILLCVFLALSAPNFGTLARYKVGFLPFLVFVLLANPLVEKLIRDFLKKYIYLNMGK